MLRHMQKLLGHVLEYAGTWLRHCLVVVAYVRVPCIVAVDTIRGWRLFSSELLIVRTASILRAATIRGKRLFKKNMATVWGAAALTHLPQILQLMKSHKRVRPCVEAVCV